MPGQKAFLPVAGQETVPVPTLPTYLTTPGSDFSIRHEDLHSLMIYHFLKKTLKVQRCKTAANRKHHHNINAPCRLKGRGRCISLRKSCYSHVYTCGCLSHTPDSSRSVLTTSSPRSQEENIIHYTIL